MLALGAFRNAIITFCRSALLFFCFFVFWLIEFCLFLGVFFSCVRSFKIVSGFVDRCILVLGLWVVWFSLRCLIVAWLLGGVLFVCLCFGCFCCRVALYVCVYVCLFVCMYVCFLVFVFIVFVFIVVVLLSVSFLGCSLFGFLCGWLLSLVVCRWLLGFGCGWCRRLFFLFFFL